MSLEQQKRDWEELARIDPLWAILTDPKGRRGGWSLEEFFAAGEAELAPVLAVVEELGLAARQERALDFGCGVGRVTRALSGRFRHTVGVDISQEMVRRAGELNADRPSCAFVQNERADLRQFESASFDLVHSTLVLQHMPTPAVARAYIAELLRLVRPGGAAVFQVPDRIPPRFRAQPKRRLYRLGRLLGLRERFLLERAGLTPMRMIAVPEPDVRSVIAGAGAFLARTEPDGAHGFRYYTGVSPPGPSGG